MLNIFQRQQSLELFCHNCLFKTDKEISKHQVSTLRADCQLISLAEKSLPPAKIALENEPWSNLQGAVE